MTDTELDTLLQHSLLQPPAGFSQQVLRQLPRQTARAAQATPWSRLRWLLTTTGLVGGGLLGLSQAASFVFGLWLAASAI